MVQVIDQSTPGQAIGQSLGEGMGGALQLLINQKLEDLQEARERRKAQINYQELLSKGFTPNEASLWLKFTEGGKTHLAKEIVERQQRQNGLDRRGLGQQPTTGLDFLQEKVTPQGEEIEAGIESENLTPKEKTARQENRYKQNLPIFQEYEKRVQGHNSEGLSLQRLQELNKTGKLPQGLQRWNVNLSSGELRLPFLANAETQAFVKTINDFTTKAKDSFGARVTNFELNRFMKRLPTLLNTEEGRSVILRQMEIINQINNLHDQALLDAFDKEGGLRNIDYDKAKKIADKQSKPMVENLKKEFISLESKSKKALKKREKNALKKVEKGTKLTEDIVDQLLDQTGNDIEKAKKLARQLGYEF